MKQIENITINYNSKIIEALKQMDENRIKLLIVTKNGKYNGLLSIGDIQRAILSQKKLNSHIGSIQRSDYIVAKPSDNFSEIRNIMINLRLQFMPVIDSDLTIQKVLFWEDIFDKEKSNKKLPKDISVIIMAGGKGERLKPLTNIIPKPLIPLKTKAIIHEIIESFIDAGASNYIITVNYKAEMIKQYLNENCKNANISYIKESKPLGTAGSLKLIKSDINNTFFVSNCDILIDQDYSEILDYHKNNNNELTIVAAMKHLNIPYGVIKTKENGMLSEIDEKPDFFFQVNTGLYILEKHLIDEIPNDQFFHITQLVDKIQNRKGKVGVFPISEGSWSDIGEWDEYRKILERY